jgi:integrase
VVYAGTDPLTGKARRLKEAAPDWNTAQAALTRLQRQVDERQHPRTSVTVGQVVSQWLEVARHEDSTRERVRPADPALHQAHLRLHGRWQG